MTEKLELLAVIAGLAAIVVGVAKIYGPLGWIVCGLAVAAFGLLGRLSTKGKA